MDKDTADFSIFYHDAVYNVLRKVNEQRSAALADGLSVILPYETRRKRGFIRQMKIIISR